MERFAGRALCAVLIMALFALAARAQTPGVTATEINTLGTPPNSAIHRYMNQSKVPHLFLATGASKWNDPKSATRK